MPLTIERCGHCNVEIRDQSTMVERNGKHYCCNNCAMAATEMLQH